MAGGFLIDNLANYLDYGSVVSAATHGTTITANASINTKGSYTQLVASTTYDVCGFWLLLGAAGTSGAAYSVDIAVGAGGSEQIIVADFVFQQAGTVLNSVYFPIGIPAGSRVAARCQSTTTVATINVSIIGADGNFVQPHLGNCTTYGFNSATTLGTNIDPGGSANTNGAYSQITASTTYDINAISLALDGQSTSTTGTMYVDIAVGGAGSEQVIIPNIAVLLGANKPSQGSLGAFPVQIPAGSRIAIRAQCTNTTAGTRKIGATVYGIS